MYLLCPVNRVWIFGFRQGTVGLPCNPAAQPMSATSAGALPLPLWGPPVTIPPPCSLLTHMCIYTPSICHTQEILILNPSFPLPMRAQALCHSATPPHSMLCFGTNVPPRHHQGA